MNYGDGGGWVGAGSAGLNKPTHFEVADGRFDLPTKVSNPRASARADGGQSSMSGGKWL